jgi:hypothetical protein
VEILIIYFGEGEDNREIFELRARNFLPRKSGISRRYQGMPGISWISSCPGDTGVVSRIPWYLLDRSGESTRVLGIQWIPSCPGD